ncbi:hypothetical protein HHUSO_G22688 [Huso huso]|uniref:Uncharacterized protein n=1 Tax=Huso huso TaxID=61971 RepID=A0ABR0YVW0_HUSHU
MELNKWYCPAEKSRSFSSPVPPDLQGPDCAVNQHKTFDVRQGVNSKGRVGFREILLSAVRIISPYVEHTD